ncbi:MAG TPA: TerC/Alx family metal homeostasis membrane protein, partial [Pyrinomonadaceae bacterium]|nr:TerC/Alx family metal homeostasis membrane protein [Pyrinomonadaceae bacterium]
MFTGMNMIWAWVGFAVFILIMLALDLGVLNRKAHTPSYREATIWSIVWVSLALCFGAGVFWRLGNQRGLEFLTGYVIELSLSVDNLFVFLLLFSYFRVPSKYQHRVLFWGVLGALVMRIVMIALGAALIDRFHWIIYIFGAFLVYTGIKMMVQEETDPHPEQNPIVRFVTRFVPLVKRYEGENFFTRENGKRVGTLLLLVLIIVEVTDLVFAVDSKTGKRCTDFGTNGEVTLLAGMGDVKPGFYYVTSPPTMAKGVAVLGGWVADNVETQEPSGVVRGF